MTTAGDVYFIEVDTKQVSQKTLFRRVFFSISRVIVTQTQWSFCCFSLLLPYYCLIHKTSNWLQRIPKNQSLRNLEVFSTVPYAIVISPEYNPGSTPQMLFSI